MNHCIDTKMKQYFRRRWDNKRSESNRYTEMRLIEMKQKYKIMIMGSIDRSSEQMETNEMKWNQSTMKLRKTNKKKKMKQLSDFNIQLKLRD